MPSLKKVKKAPAVKRSEPEWEVGQKVSFEDEGNTLTGEITEVDGETITIETEDGAYEVEAGDLTKVEDEPDEVKPRAKTKAKAGNGAAKPKGRGTSFAKLFNEAEPADVVAGFPDGNWEALIIGGEVNEDDEKGISCYLEYVGVNDEKVEGKTQRTYFQLADAEGEPQQGLNYFKRALSLLGREEVQIEDIADLTTIIEDIAADEPWVSIQVKTKKGYSNIYLQGLMDDQDDKPERPQF